VGRPNSGAVDSALIGALQADTTLAGLMPDGVYFTVAAPGLTRFVLVGIFDSVDDGVFGHRGIESTLYFVKAVGLSRATTIQTMKAAAQRIDELLELAFLPVPDYSFLDCVREERIAETVRDPVDPSLLWFHFGGHYRVQVAWPDVLAVQENPS
jgi:hypothetical protein